MKIARKEFRHPSGKHVKVERIVTRGFWNPVQETVIFDEWQPYTLSEVLQQVKDFVDKIAPHCLINISEFTTCRYHIGDDQNNHFVVWYWDEENPDSGEVQRGRDVAEQSTSGCCQGGNAEGCGSA